MALLRALVTIFLLPGTLVINRLGITVENDGGILRSFINMIFWGLIGIFFILAFTLR